MKVKDQEIKRVLVNAYNKDHSGLTRSDVDVVTLFKWDTFNGNTVIEDFSDFGDIFRNVTTIEGSAFAGCKNLKFFSLPIHQKVSIEDRGFDNTALDERSIDFSRVSKLGKWAFRYACFKHVYILFGIDLSNAIEAFSSNDDLIKLEVGEGYTFVRRFAQNCPKLIKLVYPATTEIVEGSMLHGCNSIQSFVMKAETPPTFFDITNLGYTQSNFSIYVPDASLNAYKVAEIWNVHASKIKPMSEYIEQM